jgi:thiol-disulfide isomerase/thioredoxin
MLKKALTVLLSSGLALAAIGYVLYLGNAAPVAPPLAAADLANPARPYVIKLHAQWCPVCMVTKGVWGEIEKTYAGRVNLVVFDVTREADTAASRAEARRLGLESFFEEYEGSTGLVVVLSARREVLASIKGSRDFSHYRAAIDASLTAEPSGEPSR